MYRTFSRNFKTPNNFFFLSCSDHQSKTTKAHCYGGQDQSSALTTSTVTAMTGSASLRRGSFSSNSSNNSDLEVRPDDHITTLLQLSNHQPKGTLHMKTQLPYLEDRPSPADSPTLASSHQEKQRQYHQRKPQQSESQTELYKNSPLEYTAPNVVNALNCVIPEGGDERGRVLPPLQQHHKQRPYEDEAGILPSSEVMQYQDQHPRGDAILRARHRASMQLEEAPPFAFGSVTGAAMQVSPVS